jgi:transposase
MTVNKSYTKECKEKIIKSLQPPENRTVPQVAKEKNIPVNTIYTWVSKARKEGKMIPNSSPSNEIKWRKEDKFRILMETYTLNEEELSIYCREHGLYTTDVKRWRKILENSLETNNYSSPELKAEKEKNKKLEKELKYKEKALAETAALLVLRKKTDAIWGDHAEE